VDEPKSPPSATQNAWLAAAGRPPAHRQYVKRPQDLRCMAPGRPRCLFGGPAFLRCKPVWDSTKSRGTITSRSPPGSGPTAGFEDQDHGRQVRQQSEIRPASRVGGKKAGRSRSMKGTIGPDVHRYFPSSTNTAGMFTYDPPGFTSTGSCESKITYIDRPTKGVPASIAATRSKSSPSTATSLETCYLLLYGEIADRRPEGRFRLSGLTRPHDGP